MKSSSALTRREVEVADLICRGLSQSQTARTLRIGAETVKSHVRNIRKKLKSPNTISAMVRYSEMRSALAQSFFERAISAESSLMVGASFPELSIP